MKEFLATLSPILLIVTLLISVFVVGGVFIHKFKNSDSDKTYPRWRLFLLYTGILSGYIGGIITEFLVFNEGFSSLRNLIIITFFYVASAIIVSVFVFKEPIGEDKNGQKVDYRSVQFFLILVLGFLPIILLSY